DVHPAVARLRARLAASPDPTEALASGAGARIPDRFDEALEEAVRHAQTRHGLEADGVVGSDTWAALAAPVEERVAALRSALEHWRWLPDSFGAETTLWVDVPSFQLTVLEKGRSILDMPVVVGAPGTPTPPLVDTLESVVVHPQWNVPESILRGELAPAQAADPNHLAAGGYEVLDASGALVDPSTVDWSRPSSWPAGLRVRQRSGPSNALGAIKFLFPNHHAVYLHDSPARHLYARADRALSHGCVRLSDPWALAELLAERGVVSLDVGTARRAGVRRAVGVRTTIPVFFTHFAARAEHSDRAPRFPRPFPGLDLSGAVDRP
ncbi:MAG: L,D-transpeptidase family protein, partial [Longimicrobiales bacterium]